MHSCTHALHVDSIHYLHWVCTILPSLRPFLIDFAFSSMHVLYSVYCQLSHSLTVVWDHWDVTHPVAITCTMCGLCFSSAYVAVRKLCFNFHLELGMVLRMDRVHNLMSLVEDGVIWLHILCPLVQWILAPLFVHIRMLLVCDVLFHFGCVWCRSATPPPGKHLLISMQTRVLFKCSNLMRRWIACWGKWVGMQ